MVPRGWRKSGAKLIGMGCSAAVPSNAAARLREWSIRRARARVATHTASAPASISTRDAARAVAPVVKMSSTSSTCRPATAAGSETPKAPRIFSRRCRGVSPAWLSVERKRISVLDASTRRQFGSLTARIGNRLDRDQARLVESALNMLRPMQRYWNNQQFWRAFSGNLFNRARQQLPQARRHSLESIVFERVNQRAHPPLIGAAGYRLHKRRRSQPARAAERRCAGTRARTVQAVAAPRTTRAPIERDFSPAGSTNRRKRELRQRGAAERTIGGEKSATDRIHWTSEHAGYGAPAGYLRGRNVGRQ